MNAKKAKALRKMIGALHGQRPEHAYKEMGFNLGNAAIVQTVTVAGDTQRGQYIAMKKQVKEQYK